MVTDFDILIVGGGMVGASLALALRGSPLRVGLIEAVARRSTDQPSFDYRAIALSQGSKRIFDTLGLWQPMAAAGVTPIRQIHVSDRGHFGKARLSAAEEGVEALGYVVEAGVIGGVLTEALEQKGGCELICPARVEDVAARGEGVEVSLQREGGPSLLSARLVVAADGGESQLRQGAGVRMTESGYGQSAIISYLLTDRPHAATAYERFTDTGPLAMLPCGSVRAAAHESERRWSLVWTVRDEQVEEILALNDEGFIERLHGRLGFRPGRVVSAAPRKAYPLRLRYAREPVGERIVFIGNAAHAIHPVAGQGFNLGLRDVAALAEVLHAAALTGGDPGSPAVLDRYARWRQPDYRRTIGLTHSFARLFSNALLPLAAARNVGLVGLDLFRPAKRLLARQMMGFEGTLPRLARGLPLA